MDRDQQAVQDQATLWNGAGGRGWVELQDVIGRLFGPLRDVLVESLGPDPAGQVLDVGCGTGDTTRAIARALGPHGSCTGIDISEPMVTAARSRSEQEGATARFVVADAQRHRFEPASFDLFVSRFGVMFFDDVVEAFANLRAAARDGGAMRFIVWRTSDENPFLTTAERVAASLVTIPPREPGGPGPFALADASEVRKILERSGWGGIDLRPIDVTCALPESELGHYLARIGPLGRILADRDTTTQTRVVEAVRPAFDPFVVGNEVRFTAACWLIGAQA